jgi:hypothetical protein
MATIAQPTLPEKALRLALCLTLDLNQPSPGTLL